MDVRRGVGSVAPEARRGSLLARRRVVLFIQLGQRGRLVEERDRDVGPRRREARLHFPLVLYSRTQQRLRAKRLLELRPHALHFRERVR